MSTPTVSVCMPNYNDAGFLPAALGSWLRQSHQPLEIIVVDDHSTDDSMAILEDLATRHPIIKLHRNERNLGVNATLARLTELAQGDYVAYPASNDIAFPSLLEHSVAALRKHPQAGLTSAGMIVIDAAGNSKGVLHHSIASRSPRYFSPDDIRALLMRDGAWFFASNTTVRQRQAVIEAGLFQDDLHAFADEFQALVISLRHGACHIPLPLGAWRENAEGFGTACWGDPEVAPGMVEAVARVIDTSYPDLFPPGYVERLRGVLAVNLRLAEVDRKGDARRARLTATRFARSPLGRLSLPLATAVQRAQYQGVNVALRLRLGLPLRRQLIWKIKDLIGRLRPVKVP